jgi:aspartate/methionine/tyrosine aminotransferase
MPSFPVAARLAPFGTSIFAEMTALAVKHNAVNLAQGFPDFNGPIEIRDAAIAALRSESPLHNQYARMFGVPELNNALAEAWAARGLPTIDPNTSITVTTGCTEAIPAVMLGLLNPGDEIILFEPFYDSYRACVSMAGAVPRIVRLHPPDLSRDPNGQFWFDPAELKAAFTSRTRAILVNTPHNPTGKVFTRDELILIADLCKQFDAIAVTDEVYEHLVYEANLPHVSLAGVPGMFERTVTMSSLGKTFSLTGWKIGWVIAPPDLTKGVRAAHQFLTFGASTPLQHAAAAAIRSGRTHIDPLVAQFKSNRAYLTDALRNMGFGVHSPAGSYFIMADHSRFGFASDRAFCEHLASEVGVAAIPPSAFYEEPSRAKSLVRFAFCKKRETLEAAVQRLAKLKPASTR